MKTILNALKEQGYSGATIGKALGGTTIAEAVAGTESYIVSFSANGGSGTVAPATCAKGATITLPDGKSLTAPSQKQFAGWATSASAAATAVITTYAASEDATLYAIWVNAEE